MAGSAICDSILQMVLYHNISDIKDIYFWIRLELREECVFNFERNMNVIE